jgi:hypothetical protein
MLRYLEIVGINKKGKQGIEFFYKSQKKKKTNNKNN